jgi:NADPH:quinone reductase-like Zn-dependent oxidoreductase
MSGKAPRQKIGELQKPVPQRGEVLIRVHVSAVSPSDTKQRSRRDGDAAMPFVRIIPHNEGAGIIEASFALMTAIPSIPATQWSQFRAV